MEENNNIEDLQKAYEADRQRKASREEELKDAKQYLELLLKEVEGKEEEAVSLRKSLTESKEKIEQLTSGPKARQSRLTRRVLLVVAVVELVCIIGLLAYFVFIKENPQTETKTTEKISSGIPLSNNESDSTVVSEKKKIRDDLQPLASTIISGNYKCTSEIRDGLEYLVFSDGSISVGYKNEYYTNDVTLRNAVFVEKDGRRYLFPAEYDLSGDLLDLVPKKIKIGTSNYLVFAGSPPAGSGIPSMLRLFDCEGFKLFESDHLEKQILGLFDFEYDEEQTEDESYVVFTARTVRARYNYKLDSSVYDEMVYFERNIPDLFADFQYDISEDGIHWSTIVRLYDRYVLGTLEGTFVPLGNEIGIAEAKYASFVHKRFAESGDSQLIIPQEEMPEIFYPVNWFDSRRLLVPVDNTLKMANYDFSRLNADDPNNYVYYDGDGREVSIRGIDVSKFQGDIDWKKVAAEGVKFAMIRLGFRGMTAGTLDIDEKYKANIEGALANGIKVGVYFFSEAINVEEAIEEADFVLDNLKGYDVEYPVVFDTEKVTTYDARANGLSMDERTDICLAFCDRIRKAGYTPMIYANIRYMLTGIDIERLEDVEKWYAEYSSDVKFPYEYGILQYSESGRINGINGNVDLDIAFKDYSEK